jgi:hypothetical protein
LIVISVLTRRLREGKAYEDFREAWLRLSCGGSDPHEHRRHERVDAVVEPEMTRHFDVQVAEDDFTEVAPNE